MTAYSSYDGIPAIANKRIISLTPPSVLVFKYPSLLDMLVDIVGYNAVVWPRG
jgi:hypothetical protein